MQIVKIWEDYFGPRHRYVGSSRYLNSAYEVLHDRVSTEFGLFGLVPTLNDEYEALVKYFTTVGILDHVLDIIDLSFALAGELIRSEERTRDFGSKMQLAEAIRDVNSRFLQHGLGYAIVADKVPYLVRKDN